MRAPLSLAAVLVLRVCDAPLPTEALMAHHGGVVVPFEAHAVELVVRADGEVEAWVLDGSAAAAPGEQVVVVVPGADTEQEVALAWDAASGSYKGRAGGPVVEGSVTVRLVEHGAPVSARAPHVVVAAPRTTIVVGAAPPGVTTVPAGSVTAAAPRTSVVVVPPSPPSVVLPPPRVVVIPPPPGLVIVDEDRDERHDEDRDGRHDEDRDGRHDEGRGRGRRSRERSVTITPGPFGPSVTVEGGRRGRGRR
jgi:hypothetical protein